MAEDFGDPDLMFDGEVTDPEPMVHVGDDLISLSEWKQRQQIVDQLQELIDENEAEEERNSFDDEDEQTVPE